MPVAIRMTLPSSTTDYAEKKWVSLLGVSPADPEAEGTIISTLIIEINEKFAIPTAGRGAGEARFILLGASHAIRLAKTIQRTRASTIVVARPGWRISNDAVDSLNCLFDDNLAAARRWLKRRRLCVPAV